MWSPPPATSRRRDDPAGRVGRELEPVLLDAADRQPPRLEVGDRVDGLLGAPGAVGDRAEALVGPVALVRERPDCRSARRPRRACRRASRRRRRRPAALLVGRSVRAVGPRRLGRREPGGGELRHAHAVEAGVERLRRARPAPPSSRSGAIRSTPARVGGRAAGRTPGRRARRRRRLTVRTAPLGVRHRRRQLVLVARHAVGARRRPAASSSRSARRGRSARSCARARRERARGQLAVGVVAVAVRAPARVAALGQPVGGVVAVLQALAVGGDDRASGAPRRRARSA